MFVDQIAVAIDGARTLAGLDHLSRTIWQGLAAGALSDEDAQRLAELIHARRMAAKAPQTATEALKGPQSIFPIRRPQRAPVRSVAIERRRRLASSGPLPPSIASQFTVGELAVLRIIGDECREKGACMLPLAAIAARAGVCRKLVQNTLRLARRHGLLQVDERRRPDRPSLTNVVKITSAEWRAWLARGPRSEGIGGKKIAPTDTSLGFRKKERAERSAQTWRDSRERRRGLR